MLDGLDVGGKQARRIARTHTRLLLERDHVRDEAVHDSRRASAVARGLETVAGRRAAQPGNVSKERGERRRGRGDDSSDRRRLSARFEKSFPQVDEMTLDLHFAGPAQIGLCDGDAVERVAAVDALMSADDLSVFQRERVE